MSLGAEVRTKNALRSWFRCENKLTLPISVPWPAPRCCCQAPFYCDLCPPPGKPCTPLPNAKLKEPQSPDLITGTSVRDVAGTCGFLRVYGGMATKLSRCSEFPCQWPRHASSCQLPCSCWRPCQSSEQYKHFACKKRAGSGGNVRAVAVTFNSAWAHPRKSSGPALSCCCGSDDVRRAEARTPTHPTAHTWRSQSPKQLLSTATATLHVTAHRASPEGGI